MTPHTPAHYLHFPPVSLVRGLVCTVIHPELVLSGREEEEEVEDVLVVVVEVVRAGQCPGCGSAVTGQLCSWRDPQHFPPPPSSPLLHSLLQHSQPSPPTPGPGSVGSGGQFTVVGVRYLSCVIVLPRRRSVSTDCRPLRTCYEQWCQMRWKYWAEAEADSDDSAVQYCHESARTMSPPWWRRDLHQKLYRASSPVPLLSLLM